MKVPECYIVVSFMINKAYVASYIPQASTNLPRLTTSLFLTDAIHITNGLF